MKDVVESVLDDVRWNYHETLRSQHKPVYVGRLPGWRFANVLEDSEEVEQELSWYNAVTGHGSHHSPKIEWEEEEPADAAKTYRKTVPETVEPHITAIIAGGQLRYRTKPITWEIADDDLIKHYSQQLYRGVLKTAPEEEGDSWPSQGTVDQWQDTYFVSPEKYSLVDYEVIADNGETMSQDEEHGEVASERVITMLSGLDKVTGYVPASLAPANNTTYDTAEVAWQQYLADAIRNIVPSTLTMHAPTAASWDTGEDAAAYWQEYAEDDLDIQTADAVLKETPSQLRYYLNVTAEQPSDETRVHLKFRAETPNTDEEREHLIGLMN